MKCEHCGNNEAAYQYTIVIGDKQMDRYLCADCAKQLGYESGSGTLSFDQLFSDFLSAKAHAPAPEAACPRCGYTWTDIQQSGKVGCAGCYETFADRLLPFVQKLHGTSAHVGRGPQQTPAAAETETEQLLKTLKAQLDAAVADQNYEQAAVYRDEIRALQTRAMKGGGA